MEDRDQIELPTYQYSINVKFKGQLKIGSDNSIYLYDEDKFEFSEESEDFGIFRDDNGVYISDTDDIINDVLEFLDDKIVELDSGLYNINLDVTLVYDVDGLVVERTYYDYNDYDDEPFENSADVNWNKNKSTLNSFNVTPA